MSSIDTDSSHSDAISDDLETMEESLARYDPRQLLPYYSTFLDQLQHVDVDTLPPNDECPICRLPYSTSFPEFNEGKQNLSMLRELPFHDGINDDCPVRLPCASHHVVGRACMIEWTTKGGGTSCPMDREELFIEDPFLADLSREENEDATWDRRRQNIDLEIPIRDLLRCFRAATDADIIQVDAGYMCERLATLLIRVVYRRAGFQTPSHFKWPWITQEYPNLWRSEQVECFQRLVRDFIRDEPLTESGTYPPHIVALLDPTLPHIFALLYRLAELHEAESLPASRLASKLHTRATTFFADFHALIPNATHLRRLTSLTIDTWVAQELLTTRLRRETDYLPSWFDESHPNSPRLDRYIETDADVMYFRAPDLDLLDDGVHPRRMYASPRSLKVAGMTGPAVARILSMAHQGDFWGEEGGREYVGVPEGFFNYMWEYVWEAGVRRLGGEEENGEREGGGGEEYEYREGVVARALVPGREQMALGDGQGGAAPPGTISFREIVLADGRIVRSEGRERGNGGNDGGGRGELQ